MLPPVVKDLSVVPCFQFRRFSSFYLGDYRLWILLMGNYGCTTHFSSFVAIDLRVFSPSRMAYYVLTTFITLFDPSKVYTRIFWYFLIEFEKNSFVRSILTRSILLLGISDCSNFTVVLVNWNKFHKEKFHNKSPFNILKINTSTGRSFEFFRSSPRLITSPPRFPPLWLIPSSNNRKITRVRVCVSRIIIDYSNFDFVPLCPRKRQGLVARKKTVAERSVRGVVHTRLPISALLSAIVRAW